MLVENPIKLCHSLKLAKEVQSYTFLNIQLEIEISLHSI